MLTSESIERAQSIILVSQLFYRFKLFQNKIFGWSLINCDRTTEYLYGR